MQSILDQIFLGNTIRDWLVSLAIVFGSVLIARLLRSIVISRIREAAKQTKTSFDDFLVRVLQRSVMPFLYILAVYYGIRYLTISQKLSGILHKALMAVAVFFVIRIISDMLSYSFQRFANKENGSPSQVNQARGILLIFKVILWVLGAIFLIDNYGYNITTIIAGLGIGGIAIALAAQAVLGDLFSYLVIFFDKPFEIGDFIIIGDKMGTVEFIGIKTTRLRALSGEQLVMSNTDLTNSRVQNFKRMERRRVVLSIGVTYDTPVDKLKLIPSIAQKIIDQPGKILFDRAHFSGFGDFSLNFEIVYYILSSDYNLYMDLQQNINLSLFDTMAKEKIEFAYPTQKLFVDLSYARSSLQS